MKAINLGQKIRKYTDGYCNELYLNCIEIDLPVAAAITQLLRRQQERQERNPMKDNNNCFSWKSIEIEECTGPMVGMLMTVICAHRMLKKFDYFRLAWVDWIKHR